MGGKVRTPRRVKVVRVSQELLDYVKKFADPLVDDFEDALRKALKIK